MIIKEDDIFFSVDGCPPMYHNHLIGWDKPFIPFDNYEKMRYGEKDINCGWFIC